MSQLLTSQDLHEQLSVIMAALSKAAVLDICELLERGLAGLRDEVHRSQEENRELRSRLSLIESVVVRGSLAGPCRDIPEDGRHQPEIQRDHREGQADGEAPDCGEVPDVVLIKDEDSDSEEENVMSAVDMEDVTEDVATMPPLSQRRKRKGQEKDSDRKSGLTGAVSMAAVYSLDAAQLDVDEVAAEESSACEKADGYLHQGDACLRTADQLSYFPNVALPGSHPSENVCWSEPVSNDVTSAGFDRDEPTDAFGLQIVSVSGSALPDGAAAVKYREGKASGKGRRHVCGVCNKTFATAQSRDVHMRIHTGERPYSCQQCGRRFRQMAHLKSHLNFHTVERPFVCPLCPGTFLNKYTLTMHLKKLHADT
ncbi:adult enhancer factor 1-like isoform X2 [Hippocampus comes]|uniref:Adult enhancer factor 1-like n=1 Tax=Hippocampus comes TaxID=109280 RepID=A0A3Q3DXT5_HIPCM|nr:PREDICTED: adult enhancer factor 1-like isoform X2 [Hippocampus comes]